MYVELITGEVIERATLLGAGPSVGEGMAFGIDGWLYRNDPRSATAYRGWIGQGDIRLIRFDRDVVTDPAPEPGPEDYKIGTRHDPVAAIFTEDRAANPGKYGQ